MAKRAIESISSVRVKSKSIKKDQNTHNSVLSNSLQTTGCSFSASQDASSSAQSNLQKRVKFTAAEDEIILKFVQLQGKKWAEIAEILPGRTEIMVRNRYYVKLRQMNKESKSSQISANENGLQQQTTNGDSVSEQQSCEDMTWASPSHLTNDHPIFEDENQFEAPEMCLNKSNLNTANYEANQQSQQNNNSQLLCSAQNEKTHQDFFENEHIPEVQNERENQQFQDFPISGDNKLPSYQLTALEDDDDFFEEANMPFKMPELAPTNEFVQDYHKEISDPAKQEKIQFLQNQISMIEDMLSTCKNEIIRELAFRNTPTTIPITADNSIQNIHLSPSTPFTNLNNFPSEQQDPLAELEGNNIPINDNMDIEVQASSFFHEDEDQFGYFFQHKPFSPLDHMTNFDQF